jgi:hypothetical protein
MNLQKKKKNTAAGGKQSLVSPSFSHKKGAVAPQINLGLSQDVDNGTPDTIGVSTTIRIGNLSTVAARIHGRGSLHGRTLRRILHVSRSFGARTIGKGAHYTWAVGRYSNIHGVNPFSEVLIAKTLYPLCPICKGRA